MLLPAAFSNSHCHFARRETRDQGHQLETRHHILDKDMLKPLSWRGGRCGDSVIEDQSVSTLFCIYETIVFPETDNIMLSDDTLAFLLGNIIVSQYRVISVLTGYYLHEFGILDVQFQQNLIFASACIVAECCSFGMRFAQG
jgi:hypothetical protein